MIAVIAGLNFALWLGGERDTLMLPLGAMEFPALELAAPKATLAALPVRLIYLGGDDLFVWAPTELVAPFLE